MYSLKNFIKWEELTNLNKISCSKFCFMQSYGYVLGILSTRNSAGSFYFCTSEPRVDWHYVPKNYLEFRQESFHGILTREVLRNFEQFRGISCTEFRISLLPNSAIFCCSIGASGLLRS
jgi:hypothetical protein